MGSVKLVQTYHGTATKPDVQLTSLDTTGMDATQIATAWSGHISKYTQLDEIDIEACPAGWPWWVWYYLYKVKSYTEERNGVIVRIWTVTAP